MLWARKVVRGCESSGFFAEFFWVLNHLEWCVATNHTPVVYWDSNFAYYSKDGYNGSTNGWEYYFEPVSSLRYEPSDRIHKYVCFFNSTFTTIWWYSDYINNLNLLSPEEQKSIKRVPLPGSLAGRKEYPTVKHLYDVQFRKRVKSELIDRFIVIKKNIQAKIDRFYEAQMKGRKVIGIHLRGGFIAGEVTQVPLQIICEEANKHAGENTIFFVATDQFPLIEEAKKLLKGKVIYYPCRRMEHTTSPVRGGQWPPEMGEDVLVETKLLSLCDYFVHTISNVSTAALYFNPGLPHTMLYCAEK